MRSSTAKVKMPSSRPSLISVASRTHTRCVSLGETCTGKSKLNFFFGSCFINLDSANGPSYLLTYACLLSRIALTAIVVSCKMYDDNYATNTYYAAVGGVDAAELNRLELVFMSAIEWRVFVKQHNMALLRS